MQRKPILYHVVLLLSVLILLTPIWIVEYPPLVDYPSHLDRAYALSEYSSDSIYRTQYRVNYTLTPNLGSDLVLPIFIQVFPMRIAGKIFLSFIILLFAAGCYSLGRVANGSLTWSAIIAVFIVFNSDFLWGFINYIFGLGFFLFGLAAWIKFRYNWNPIRMALFSALAACCYIVHLSSLAFLVISIVAIKIFPAIMKRKPKKSTIIVSCLALCAISVLLTLLKISLPGSPPILWSSPMQKAIFLLSPILTYSRAVDLAVIALVVISGLLLILNHSVDLNPILFFSALCILAAFLLIPNQIGWIGAIDARATPAFLPLFLLSLKFETKSVNWKLRFAFLVAFLAFTIKMFAVSYQWSGISEELSAHLERIDQIPTGATLFPIAYDDYCAAHKSERAMLHLVSYSVHDRHALIGNLWPGLLQFRKPQPHFLFLLDSSLSRYNWPRIFSYDYLWAYHPKPAMIDTLQSHCQLMTKYDSAYLFRVINRSNK